MHLAAGVTAGVIILVMSITGALLALKPQILNAVESNVRVVAPPSGAARLGVAGDRPPACGTRVLPAGRRP